MTRVIVALLGVLLAVLGIASASLGAVGVAAFGTEGRNTSEVASVESLGAAVYVRSLSLSLPESVAGFVPQSGWEVSVVASSASEKEVFVGVAPADQVQGFLAGVPYDAASEISQGVFVTKPVPGSVLPAPPPSEQDFWVASGQGRPASMVWQPEYSGLVLVVMNADGSAGIQDSVSAQITAERAFPISVGLIVIGALILIFGLWLIWRSMRRRTSA